MLRDLLLEEIGANAVGVAADGWDDDDDDAAAEDGTTDDVPTTVDCVDAICDNGVSVFCKRNGIKQKKIVKIRRK